MMDIHTATELAYKNGYAKGFADGKAEIESTLKYSKDTIKTEVAREIFEGIDKLLDFAREHSVLLPPYDWIDWRFVPYYNELKMKYKEVEIWPREKN